MCSVKRILYMYCLSVGTKLVYSCWKAEKHPVDLIYIVTGDNTKIERWAAWSSDCWVWVGKYGANDCSRKHGSRRICCSLWSAQHRRSDHVCEWSQSRWFTSVHLPKLHQGNRTASLINRLLYKNALSSELSELKWWLKVSWAKARHLYT